MPGTRNAGSGSVAIDQTKRATIYFSEEQGSQLRKLAKETGKNFSYSTVTEALAAKGLRKELSTIRAERDKLKFMASLLLDYWHSHHAGPLADCTDPTCAKARSLLSD
jgi:hypothetical protein